jgi:hypothetical protein
VCACGEHVDQMDGGVAQARHRLEVGDTHAAATAPATTSAAGTTATRPDKPSTQVTDGLRSANNRHVSIVCDVLTHMAGSVGNVIGVAIRLGHGDIGRSRPKPSVDTATPVRGIQAVSLTR